MPWALVKGKAISMVSPRHNKHLLIIKTNMWTNNKKTTSNWSWQVPKSPNNLPLCARHWNPQKQCGCLVAGEISEFLTRPSIKPRLLLGPWCFLIMCWFSTIVLSGDVKGCVISLPPPPQPQSHVFSIVGRQLCFSFAENLEVTMQGLPYFLSLLSSAPQHSLFTRPLLIFLLFQRTKLLLASQSHSLCFFSGTVFLSNFISLILLF